MGNYTLRLRVSEIDSPQLYFTEYTINVTVTSPSSQILPSGKPLYGTLNSVNALRGILVVEFNQMIEVP
jgi:hypothetical protein